MTKTTPLFVLSSFLLAHPTLASAEELWSPRLQEQLIAGSLCPRNGGLGTSLGGENATLCFLWTAFHTNSPVSVAFARQGQETTISNRTLVLIVENDADVDLNDEDWELAIDIRQFVPAFVHEDAPALDLSMADFKALIVDGNSPNHLKCCVHSGDVNLASHAFLYGQRFGVDPEDFKARMVDQSTPLATYDALGDYLARSGSDGGLVALGLRGVDAQTPIRPLQIDGMKLGEPGYPLQVNSKVYVRVNNSEARSTFQQMIRREDRWISNDRQFLEGMALRD